MILVFGYKYFAPDGAYKSVGYGRKDCTPSMTAYCLALMPALVCCR